MPLGFFVAYPLLVHLAVALDVPPLEWLALASLYAGLFHAPLRAGRAAAWLGLLALAVGAIGLIRLGGGIYALYVPALLLPAMVFTTFALSLRPGAEPLISRIATIARGPLPPEIARYTRRMTWIWAGVVALILLTTTTLMFSGAREAWSWFTNVISYLLIGGLFVGEFAYRRWRFPDEPRMRFVDHLKLVVQHRPRA